MELNLENLSVEDLKTLRTNINLLLKDKCKPKYKENTCFIKPDDLFFIRIREVFDDAVYRVIINNSKGDSYFDHVNESFIDKCVTISEEVYQSLLTYKSEFLDKIIDFGKEQNVEMANYKESLINEFKDKLREVIKEYKND